MSRAGGQGDNCHIRAAWLQIEPGTQKAPDPAPDNIENPPEPLPPPSHFSETRKDARSGPQL